MFKEKQKGAQQTSVALPQCDPYLLCGVWRSNVFIILDPSYVYGLLILPTCYRGLIEAGTSLCHQFLHPCDSVTSVLVALFEA